jgi:hypothetical protein
MKITANQNFGNSLTKGKEYQVVKETKKDFIIVDDEGYQMGFSKDRFVLEEKLTTLEKIEQHLKQAGSYSDEEDRELITIDFKLFESIFNKYKSK